MKMKIRRNDPCPCGSGRIFKQCCLSQQNGDQSLTEPDSSNTFEIEPDMPAFAKALTAAVAGGKLSPEVQDALPEFLAMRVDTLLDFLDGLLEMAADPAIPGAHELSEASLQLLQIQLTNARFLTDRDFVSAKLLLQQFEERLIRAIRENEVRAETLVLVSNAMFRAGVEPGPQLVAACDELFERQPALEINDRDINAMLQQALHAAGDDPFDLCEAMSSAVHIGDAPLRSAAVRVMLDSHDPLIRDTAALAVLDPDGLVRKETALALLQRCDGLTPSTLRRIILVQHWLAQNERQLVQQIIDGACKNGVKCEQWPLGQAVVEIHGSGLDGTGAQTNLIVIHADKRRYRIAGLLFKQERGLADAWIGEPQSKRESAQMIKLAPAATLMPVSRAYMNRIISYYLRVGIERLQPPPAALLKIAEAMGAQWQPAEAGWESMVDEMLAGVRQEMLAPNKVAAIISSSDRWGLDGPWATSWFENNQEVADFIMSMDAEPMDAIRDALLNGIIETHRIIWAERFALTALWMKEAGAAKHLPWRNFAILARKLVEDVALTTIPLMRKIAEDTVELIRQPGEDLEEIS
ncbi:MAG: SEC-C domain-containing protein [Deltaproteobacteria bacterium]|nr:SEC-C domain-containing protein [Deltaproteobacteria bacterium]